MKDKIEQWICDKQSLDKEFRFYVSKKIIQKTRLSEEEIQGHLAKMEHNLMFAYKVLDMGGYSDWVITAYYYAVYQASFALILNKGFYSKNHTATLLLLIKFYYPLFDKDEMNFFDELHKKTVDRDLLFSYNFLKVKREEASYTIKTSYEKKEGLDDKEKSY
ncbi:MAG: hypothetical protein QXS02_01025 [Candidatus Thermoplasmatota archaeon]